MSGKVLVLLSTYNGSRFLREQLETIFAQRDVEAFVVARDDGSTDSTCAILDEFAQRGNLSWQAGTNAGPARSYFKLLDSAPYAEYYAFADQDDHWDTDKLLTAIQSLRQVEAGRPALYWCKTRPVNEELVPLRIPVCAVPEVDIQRALLRNFASGCTMVFNRSLLEAVKDAPFSDATMHDSWMFKVCLALGGAVVYDPVPHLSYRQHASNVVGSHQDIRGRANRWLRYVVSRKRTREREAGALLARYGTQMDTRDREFATLVSTYRNSFTTRMKLISQPAVWSAGPLVGLATLGAVVTSSL